MRAALFAVFSMAALSGCATPWPGSIPATTYAGTVYNEPLGRDEPNAKVSAIRPGLKLSLLYHFFPLPAAAADQVIGRARSGKDGGFTLTTTGGYATKLWVESNDGRLTGWLDRDLERGGKNLVIKVRPYVEAISYSKVSLSEADCATFQSACDKIMFHYASTGYKTTLSLSEYAKKSIISQNEFLFFESMQSHLLGAHPDIEAEWKDLILRIKSFDEPVEFKKGDWRTDVPSLKQSSH